MPAEQSYVRDTSWELRGGQALFMYRLKPNSDEKTPKKKLPTVVESFEVLKELET